MSPGSGLRGFSSQAFSLAGHFPFNPQELGPFIEQAMARKERMAPLAEEEIPSFVALGRQVAASGPQLTPEQEAMRRRMLAAAQIPLENPEKASAAE
jgi:hypothetical protein